MDCSSLKNDSLVFIDKSTLVYFVTFDQIDRKSFLPTNFCLYSPLGELDVLNN